MSAFPTVEVVVYPHECDGSGRLHAVGAIALLERARWDALLRGAGIDVFTKSGVVSGTRHVSLAHLSAAAPGDVLRVVTRLADRATTTFTLHHRVTRVRDGVPVIEAELEFECIDRLGRPAPLPEGIVRALGAPGGTRQVRRVAVADGELAVDVRGNGPALLFVHGFPLDRGQWRHQLLGFTHWQRMAPDLRGFGDSAGVAVAVEGLTMRSYVADLIAVLDGLGIERVVLCGFSMGGYVAFEFWRRHADRVRGMILVDTRPEADSPEGQRARDEMEALLRREGNDAIAERMLPRLLSRTTLEAQPESAEQVRAMIGRASADGIAGALRAMRDRSDSRDLLGSITVPVLALGGAEDALTPPPVMAAMAAAIPGARFVEVAAAAHLAPLEQPLAVNRAVGEFLETLREDG